ncbi:MAG: 4,4'-diaponeurosporenoate glycosyltransferase [Elusimicrobia bacterium]|nr:4,4'-diaponeurosporenoate glycosyltransferase [Elusimicrobiota bacterium]
MPGWNHPLFVLDFSMWLHAAFWMVGYLVLFRIRELGTLDGGTLSTKTPISVIIPARNEAERLPTLLASLQQQSIQPDEIIVVDDQSSDRTAQIATEMGATVLLSQPLPEKWLGKPWACYQGALCAKGEVLVFLDADIALEKEGLEKMVAVQHKKGGALSILPYHTMGTVVEQFSAFFNLIQAAGSTAFTLMGPRFAHPKPFGPVLVISKTDYFKFGGHEAVKGSVVENYSMAEYFYKNGISLNCYVGRNVVNFRMYSGGLSDIVGGWNKSFLSGAKGTPPVVFFGLFLWLTGCLGTARHLVTSLLMGKGAELPLLLIFYGLYVSQIHRWLTRLGTFRLLTSIFFPIPAVFFVLVFLKSTLFSSIYRSAIWKGRKIPS